MTRFNLSLAILASSLATISMAAHADVRYRLTQIAPDTPTSSILASDLNDRGQVVGSIQAVNGQMRPFAWRDGTLTDLLPLVAPAGSPQSRALGNNDRGDIVGFYFDTQSGTFVNFLLQHGQVTHIDGVPGGTDTSLIDINDRRQVMGNTFFENGSSQGFIWEHGNLMPLPPLDGDTSATGFVINERGEVLGQSVGTAAHFVIWENAQPIDLQIPSGSAPRDFNNRQQVVGEQPVSQGSSAFLWERGTFTQLPSLGDAVRARAISINDAGEIVGASDLSTGPRATLWDDAQQFDLNDLILARDPQRPFVTLESASFINDHAVIVATGRDSRFPSELRTYLLTPVH